MARIRMVLPREGWKWVRIIQTRLNLCTNSKSNAPMNRNNDKVAVDHGRPNRDLEEAYKNLHQLDFKTAAKILFTAPVNKKKFGLDFHLVQLFFCLLPSLAVYLVAQYARYDIKKMEAELEVKKKAEDEKRKKLELIAAEEEEMKSNSKLLEVKARLDKLEETVNEIAVISKQKQSTPNPAEN